MIACLAAVLFATAASAQSQPAPAAQQNVPTPAAQSVPAAGETAAAPRPSDPAIPAGYVIGADDLLSIVFWKDKDMSAEARVRPDGRIALPLINEVQAAGLTPEELQRKITEESRKYMEDASITIVVREINSRRVFITGEVAKPGPYSLTSPITVMQLIAVAGGLRDYADSKNITIMRTEGGKQLSLKFNYKEVASGKNLKQNIELQPGDTVVVP
jgi:polysaccharide export outer membrane protein